MQINVKNERVLARACLTLACFMLGCVTSSAYAGSPMSKPTLQPRVKLVTTVGNIVLELNASEAPNAVLSFVQRVEANYYDGLIFHRVLKGRLVQAGAYTPNMEQREASAVETDIVDFDNILRNERGTISAVKKSEWNNRIGAEFFINVADNFQFDQLESSGPYPVFGRVIKGLDVVDKISNVSVASNPDYAAGLSPLVPKRPIVIKSVEMLSPLDKKGVKDRVRSLHERAEYEAGAGRRAVQRMFDLQVKKIEKATGEKVTLLKSGLVVGDLREGIGQTPSLDDKVYVNYRGWLLDDTELANTYIKKPVERKVSDFVEGVRIALTTMKEGGKRMIIVPPDLGFGYGGAPSIGVPNNAFLIFDIELLEIRYDTDSGQ